MNTPAGSGVVLDHIAEGFAFSNQRRAFSTVWRIKRQQPGANRGKEGRFPAECVGFLAGLAIAGLLIVVFVFAGGFALAGESSVLVLFGLGAAAVALSVVVFSFVPSLTMVARNTFDRRYKLLVDPGKAILVLSVARRPQADADGRVIIAAGDFAVMRMGEAQGEQLMLAVCADIKDGGMVRKRGRAQNDKVGQWYRSRYDFEVEPDLTTWYPSRP
ncbi:hypothetical protein [Leifsonia aquatica]|uniref:hypothetical protein n=1 Tax=Leifsonia aquatica TaxID=144185 RepID=UPI0012DE8EA5|nr:hypothetical protein [Leifsonia aquatica]